MNLATTTDGESSPAAWRIRAATPVDGAAIERLHLAAFPEEGPQIVDLLRSLAPATRASFVAVAALVETTEPDLEPVIGHVQLSRGWVDARRALVEVLVLSPLGVDPAHQGHGIGATLVGAALEWARAHAVPGVFLEGDPGYYGRLGFEPAARHHVTPPSERIPAAACQLVVTGDWPEWLRGRLVYADAFWATDTVGLRDPLLAELETRFGAPS